MLVLQVVSPGSRGQDVTRSTSSDDIQALAEIWTLAGCNELLTSVHSTFGYVAHGLSSQRPWVISEGVGSCERALSPSPCFHAFYKVASAIQSTCSFPTSALDAAAAGGLQANGCGFKAQ